MKSSDPYENYRAGACTVNWTVFVRCHFPVSSSYSTIVGMTISLDGFVADPNGDPWNQQSPKQNLPPAIRQFRWSAASA